MIDLAGQGFCIFGLKGSGKSWLTKHIMDSNPDHVIYDPLKEHEGYNQYLPTNRESVPELEKFIQGIVIPRKPSLFIIDEANRYIVPKPSPLPSGVSELNDFNRHWGISVGYVARRPVQFHTDVVELANWVFFFGLHGKNDYRYMESLYAGLGDAVRNLEEYGFISLHNGKEMMLHSPVASPEHVNYT